MALINTTTTGNYGTAYAGDSSGALTIQKDGVTQGVYGNIPAFSAYKTSTQSVAHATWTKLTFETEEFDTNNNFASSTFTPTVAGYYQINAVSEIAALSVTGVTSLMVYKNGLYYMRGSSLWSPASGATAPTASTLVYCNGATDYIEIYLYITNNSSSTNVYGSAAAGTYATKFQGYLVKAT